MSAFEAAYARLQDAFRDRCADEARQLRAMTSEGRLDGAAAVALLHRLAGAAGTFGFEGVSTLAAQLETEVRLGGADLARTRELFAALDAVAARTYAATPLKALA